MTRSILRAVVCGVIVGALAFFVPHLLLGFFVLVLIVGLLHRCGRGHGCYGHYHGHERLFYLADKIRKMSEEEYAEFKTKMGDGCCNSGYHSHGHCCCGCNSDSNSDSKCDCESKKEESIQ